MGFSAVGTALGFRQAHRGGVTFQYVLIGLGVALLVLITMALRRMRPLGALTELGVLPFSLRPILAILPAVVTMAAILRLRGRVGHLPPLGLVAAFGVVGPFAEELVFRGLLFLGFRRWAAFPFWPAALLSSAFFGLMHFGQGSTLALSLGAVGVTFVGGILFCWLTECWGNLRPPCGDQSRVGHLPFGGNAVGNPLANSARLAAVAVTIAITLAFTRQTSHA